MPPKSPRDVLRTGLLAFAFLAFALVAYFGLPVVTGARLFFAHDIGGADIWHLYLPFWRQAADSVAAGELPFWSSKLGTGFPLLAEGQVGALYPPNLLFRWLLPLPAAFGVSILFHMALAGAFAAAFARRVGAGRAGSLFAGLAFGLGGFFLLHVRHPNMTASAAWFPLILLFVEDWIRTRRPVLPVLLAVAVAMSFLAGHPQMAYYNLLVAGFYATVRLLVLGLRGAPGAAPGTLFVTTGLLFGAVAGGLLAGPQIVPTYELMQVGSRREGLDLSEASRSRIGLRHLLLWLDPTAFGDPGELKPAESMDPRTGKPRLDPETGKPLPMLEGYRTGEERDLFWSVVPYIGLLPLLFALLAFRYRPPGLPVRLPLAVVLAVTLVLAAGTGGGLFSLFFYLMPGFRYFRFPGRFLVYSAFAIAVLGGLGLTAALARIRHRFVVTRPAVAPAVAAAVLLLAFLDLHHALGDQFPTVDGKLWTSPPPTVERMLAEEENTDPSTGPWRMLNVDPERAVFTHAYIGARGWKGDLSPYDPVRMALHPNLSLLYGVDALVVHSPSAIRWSDEGTFLVYPMADLARDPPVQVNGRLASLFNVRYLVDPFGVLRDRLPVLERFPGGTWMSIVGGELVEEPYSIELLKNEDALPRAFLVPGCRVVPSDPPPKGGMSPAQLALVESSFDPRYEVLISKDTPPPANLPRALPEVIADRVRFERYEDQLVRMTADAPRDCWLYLSDTYYPGWVAEVDGVETPIYRANVFGRAIRVPKGKHVVEFAYRPRSFRTGLIVALLGVFLLAAQFLFLREKRG